jgi:hypothetical protein
MLSNYAGSAGSASVATNGMQVDSDDEQEPSSEEEEEDASSEEEEESETEPERLTPEQCKDEGDKKYKAKV